MTNESQVSLKERKRYLAEYQAWRKEQGLPRRSAPCFTLGFAGPLECALFDKAQRMPVIRMRKERK